MHLSNAVRDILAEFGGNLQSQVNAQIADMKQYASFVEICGIEGKAVGIESAGAFEAGWHFIYESASVKVPVLEKEGGKDCLPP